MMPLRLLIIEDSESDAALAVNQLENAGYAVMSRQVEDQDQLKSALENQNWDIIIADFQLPEFNAPAALACLQESGLDIPFIVVSGAIGEETAVSLMKSGACDYLMKGKLTRLGPVVERELSEAKVRRDRKRAEKALQESERNLLNSQRIAHIGHWVMQPQTGEAAWSDEMCRIFGIDPENFDGNVNEIWRKAVHPDDFERVLAASDVRNEKTRLKHIEYRIIRPDGTLGYILAIAGDSIKDSTGKITQLSGVVQDITDRKQAEIALLQKMEESQQRARELEMITSVSSSMRQAETRTELVKIVLQELMMLINAQQATLAFLNGNTLTFNQALGSSKAWRAQKYQFITIFLERSSIPGSQCLCNARVRNFITRCRIGSLNFSTPQTP